MNPVNIESRLRKEPASKVWIGSAAADLILRERFAGERLVVCWNDSPERRMGFPTPEDDSDVD